MKDNKKLPIAQQCTSIGLMTSTVLKLRSGDSSLALYPTALKLGTDPRTPGVLPPTEVSGDEDDADLGGGAPPPPPFDPAFVFDVEAFVVVPVDAAAFTLCALMRGTKTGSLQVHQTIPSTTLPPRFLEVLTGSQRARASNTQQQSQLPRQLASQATLSLPHQEGATLQIESPDAKSQATKVDTCKSPPEMLTRGRWPGYPMWRRSR